MILKELSVILVFVAFTLQNFHRVFLVVNYYSNTASYAINCENKSKPQMHCNGHCQLYKQLKLDEKKDAQNPERRNENKQEELYCQSAYLNITRNWVLVTTLFPIVKASYLNTTLAAIFQPPRLCMEA